MKPAVKRWTLVPHVPEAVERLATATSVPHVVAQLLLSRGVVDPAEAKRFLGTPLNELHAPEKLPGAVEAADRIWSAVQSRQRICIYGDYDVDGTTGTAILWQTLTALGAAVEYYLPKRLDEGYGLNCEALRTLAASGVNLVITVDCGIASLDEADESRRLGLDLIVTDHHEFKERLPDCCGRVHPRLPGSDYPFSGLSGAGVAFKLAWLIGQRASGGTKVSERLREVLLDAVGLAALGLIADVMPLVGENRILVKHGLHRMRTVPTPGIKALIESAGLTAGAALRAEDVGFRLAPRLNAAGRLGCARLVVDLLTTPSEQRAKELAAYLEKQNQERQQTERRIAVQAREMVHAQGREHDRAIVLASSEWHPGVIGIVAGRLAEQFHRPTLLIAIANDSATGSGRSIPGFALHEGLAKCGEALIAHGGHAAAAGFRLHPDHIDSFRDLFLQHAGTVYPSGPPEPVLRLDSEVPLAVLTSGLVRDLDRLEPFGCGNPRPRFLAAGLTIVGEPKAMGNGERHLSFRVKQGQTTLRAVAWSMAERTADLMSAGGACCLAFVPKINEWNGYTNVEMEVVDFQPGECATLS
ncbi:MAG: single-stranded-DNA-specific exonuclease RecJ [Gemmataceae bacterium]